LSWELQSSRIKDADPVWYLGILKTLI